MAGQFNTTKADWTQDDVLHFARRAGFALRPEDSLDWVAAGPSATVDTWLLAAADESSFLQARSGSADVFYEPVTDGGNTGPHGFSIKPNSVLEEGQGHFLFSMTYGPNQFKERMSLFWHQLLATGAAKVNSLPLMLNQIQLFRDLGRGNFTDLLRAVSHDPAMLRWLDGIHNNVDQVGKAPNENFARELMELFSLGPYKGYGEQDVRAFAKIFAGWTFAATGADIVTLPGELRAAGGQPVTAKGQLNPFAQAALLDGQGSSYSASQRLPNRRNFGSETSVTLFGSSAALNATDDGESAIGLIVSQRSAECSAFLAKRLLRHFLANESQLPDALLADFAATIRELDFHIGRSLGALFKSAVFYDPAYRYQITQGPAAWLVRMNRALCPTLAQALATPRPDTTVPSFPVYAGATFNAQEKVAWFMEYAGQRLLDPKGPNGWAEGESWLNSNSARYRGRLAAALAYGPADFTSDGRSHAQFPPPVGFFPTQNINLWFPTTPKTPWDVWRRLIALIQPAPISEQVRDTLITGNSGLWGRGRAFANWNSTDHRKARDLAFLILSSPQAQVC